MIAAILASFLYFAGTSGTYVVEKVDPDGRLHYIVHNNKVNNHPDFKKMKEKACQLANAHVIVLESNKYMNCAGYYLPYNRSYEAYRQVKQRIVRIPNQLLN